MPADPPDPAAPAFEPGRRVGSFVLRRFLAAGGMGQVWEAEDLELKRPVALKLLLPGRLDQRALERFAREARAGGRLRHPNLVATYAYGEDEGVTWIAQELVRDAWTLAEVLLEQRRRERLPRDYYPRVAQLVAALADGLHAAHEAGVVHRDVKPANVLIGPDGAPRLTDFGLARMLDQSGLTRTGDLSGTWAYMSPEQVRARRDPDRRTDVFSLGVVLYELLTLRRPFEGDSAQQTAERILAFDPPEPTRLRSSCPRDLSTICLKALEKAPERRYPTAAELAADLRRHLAHESIRARPPGRVDRLRRWSRRHPAPSVGAAVGLVALVVVSALLAGTLSDARALEELALERVALARSARADRDAVLRLSRVVDAEELIEAQRALWPARPERIADYEGWLAEARSLVAELPAHRARLEELRAQARGSAADASVELRWWERRQAELVDALTLLDEELLRPGASSTARGWSVPDRLAFARRLEQGFAPGGEHHLAWERALPELRATYPGLALEPLVGFVPLGPDPDSGLWELAHLASGEPPERGADGALVRTEASALVLVLVPGGESWIGEQSADPDGPNYEPAPHPAANPLPLQQVTLAPYLVGKHELTQGQWLRLTGENPAAHRPRRSPDALLHPVENVSGNEAMEVLARHDLALPTDAQWEHACRAGTMTPFTFGQEEDARDLVNLNDRTAHEGGNPFGETGNWQDHEDGAVFHGPTGSWPPNAMGLHEVHGNVAELSLDVAAPNGDRCSVRGGHYRATAVGCRSSTRESRSKEDRWLPVGVRPVRALD
jgi:formylglycine-generating enzyme required for sulfatase activity